MVRTFGEVVRRGERFDLSFERVYATTVEDVWSAVTEPERLARWMAPYTGELRLGGRWDALNDDGSVFCSGTVRDCEPPSRYVTSWEYPEETTSTVEVTVREHPEGALLRLEHRDLADVGYGAGWQTYLEQLDEALPPAPSSVTDPDRPRGVAWGERFAALHEAWAPRLTAPGGGA